MQFEASQAPEVPPVWAIITIISTINTTYHGDGSGEGAARTKAPVLCGEANVSEAPGSGAVIIPACCSPVVCWVLVIVIVRVALPPFGRCPP